MTLLLESDRLRRHARAQHIWRGLVAVVKSALKFIGGVLALAFGAFLAVDVGHDLLQPDSVVLQKAMARAGHAATVSVTDERTTLLIVFGFGFLMFLGGIALLEQWWESLPFRKPAAE